MDLGKLKSYAPKARKEFIRAVTERAALFGLTKNTFGKLVERGDVVLIEEREHPKKVGQRYKKLETRIREDGFEQTMEAMAYTWFNRFVAIRFMELHGYLDHGLRVLSHPDGKATPEILEKADLVTFPGLSSGTILDLKLDGSKDNELYQTLVLGQCNALSEAMPFLFERIDDETELLLPDNLLATDSIIRNLVAKIDETDWDEIEIIGWLYQFYISERKAEVIGKVVACEDIPAATQLFTPSWIVKYLVQNTLGQQWLATHPQSELRQQMQYYIEPAEQTPEVKEQLKAITPTSLNPEELTLLDPACGSGHILTEAYDLLKAIYRERGYRAKDIPALVLQKNLFGLEIDDRAAQLAAFALMMKARADDRRIFDSAVKPNIFAFQESKGLDATSITNALNSPINKDNTPRKYLFEEIEDAETPLLTRKTLGEKGHVSQGDIASLLALFENAKTFGSLVQIPPMLAMKLPEIEQRLDDVLKHGDLIHVSAGVIRSLIQQARFLAAQYNAVVTNPPYMGLRNMNPEIKGFLKDRDADSKNDLFSAFIHACSMLCHGNGFYALITMQSWMFLSSFVEFRVRVLRTATIRSVLHLGANAFEFLIGPTVQTCAFVIQKAPPKPSAIPVFYDLQRGKCDEKASGLADEALRHEELSQSTFLSMDGSPLAYWAPQDIIKTFRNPGRVGDVLNPRQGMATSDNSRFLRMWFEVSTERLDFGSNSAVAAGSGVKRWFAYNKGGTPRRWYGNREIVVDWEFDGREVIAYAKQLYGSPTRTIKNIAYYFKECITWGDISFKSATGKIGFAARYSPAGAIFDVAGPSGFPDPKDMWGLLSLLNSAVVPKYMEILNPTMHFQVGDISKIPFFREIVEDKNIVNSSKNCVALSKGDYDEYETSVDFAFHPLRRLINSETSLLDASRRYWIEKSSSQHGLELSEESLDRRVCEIYGLSRLISPVDSIRAELHKQTPEELVKGLLSYAIGCMMGRYSLDKPGLIYAHSGNQGFDPSQYKTLRADDDGIIPLLDTDWGVQDDAANRIVEFIGVAWPKEHIEENLKFIADNSAQPMADSRATRSAAISLPGSTSTTFRRTRSDQSTGCFRVENSELSSASFTCIVTMKAHWRACGRNTSFRFRGALRPGLGGSATRSPRRPAPAMAKSSRRKWTISAGRKRNWPPSRRNSGTWSTSGSLSTSTTA